MPMPSLPTGHTPRTQRATGAELAALMKNATVAGPDVAPLMIAKPAKQFFLMHHPANWHLSTTHGEGKRIEHPTLLPEIQKFLISPGVFDCRTHDKHEDPSAVYIGGVAKWRKKGWIFLDPNEKIPAFALPPGVPDGGYLRELTVQHPKKKANVTRWSEAWDLPQPTLPGEPQRFRLHRESYEVWLAWLVQSGVLPDATPEVLERHRSIREGRVTRVKTMRIDPVIRDQLIETRQRFADHLAGHVAIGDQPKVDRKRKAS